jgi:hypothetical protein
LKVRGRGRGDFEGWRLWMRSVFRGRFVERFEYVQVYRLMLGEWPGTVRALWSGNGSLVADPLLQIEVLIV